MYKFIVGIQFKFARSRYILSSQVYCLRRIGVFFDIFLLQSNLFVHFFIQNSN